MTTKDNNDGDKSSSVFDSPPSSVSSVLPDKQAHETETIIVLDEDSDDNSDEAKIMNAHESDSDSISKKSINRLEIGVELLIFKPNSPIRMCTAAFTYANLKENHMIMVNNPQTTHTECMPKSHLYLSESCPTLNVPIRTRVLHRDSCLTGFVVETPCQMKNRNRYLIIYDNLTASYHSYSQFHLCLCQDFQRHMTNIDMIDIRSNHQHMFQTNHRMKSFSIGSIIHVRKFGNQHHNARVIDTDCSIIKICFFERKSQPEMWIHANASIIELSSPSITFKLPSLPSPLRPISATEQIRTPMTVNNENIGPDPTSVRLRKRKNTKNDANSMNKKLRDQSSSSNNELNTLTTYYTNTLLPKFRVLNILPYTSHKCSRQCVQQAEEHCHLDRIHSNPFLLPFEYKWSIIDGKPRGYRTPCRRTFYSLDDIEQYLYRTQSKLSIKFFLDDQCTRFAPMIEDFDKKFLIINDLSRGQEPIHLSVYNDIDGQKPEKFVYVNRLQPIDDRIRTILNNATTTTCCNCIDNCNDRMKCACFRKTLEQAQHNHDAMVIDKQKNRYNLGQILKSTGYQRKRLFNLVSSGIYECNSNCACHRQHCSNRVVQQGVFVQLQLFKDQKKGWGIRTLHDIPRGTFICQYVGELLTSDQGHERAQTMDDKYQTSLDLIKQIRSSTNTMDDEEEEEPYVIDGSLYSNLGKYFNHSCDPNMHIQNVFIKSHDLRFPNLALFTRTHVKAGQELNWHYNCELLPDREIKCYCGSKNCRGRLL